MIRIVKNQKIDITCDKCNKSLGPTLEAHCTDEDLISLTDATILCNEPDCKTPNL